MTSGGSDRDVAPVADAVPSANAARPSAESGTVQSPRRSVLLGLCAFGVMALAQIWIPLTHRRAGPTVVVVTAAAVATWSFLADAWGWRRAALALVTVVGVSLAVERIGVVTGWPFGRYRYTGALQPELWHVPLIVPLAWFALGVPAWEVASRLVDGRLARVGVAALSLTAWDLFLDPQMVGEGYWRWAYRGGWRGVPPSNFAGWLAASFVVLGLVDLIAPGQRSSPARGLALIAVYTWWAVMETVGFVVFFGDPVVGLVGGVAMGVPTVLVWQRLLAGGLIDRSWLRRPWERRGQLPASDRSHG